MENQPPQPFNQPQPRPQPALQSAPAKSSGEMFWKISTVVLMVVLAVFAFKVSSDINKLGGNVVAGNTITGNAVAGNAPAVRNAPAPSPSPTVDMAKLLDDDAVRGDAKAPVTIIEFSDYQCPFCERFYSQTEKQIEEQYVKTGKVKFVYRDFPLSFHQNAQKAAEAAECAGEQNKYWEMHDKLFDNSQGDGTGLNTADLKKYAADLKLDTTKFNDCLDTGKMTSEVQKDFLDGQKAGVQGTPAFYVNGQLISGAQPFSAFQQVIDAELAAN